jgi:hypothetical protein
MLGMNILLQEISCLSDHVFKHVKNLLGSFVGSLFDLTVAGKKLASRKTDGFVPEIAKKSLMRFFALSLDRTELLEYPYCVAC